MQLREQSLLGDAIAHAALPGVALFFLLTGSAHPVYLLIAGAVTGLCGVTLSRVLPLYTPIKQDAALGVVLSSFFGVGIACISHVQKTSSATVIALDRFLFGNAASLLAHDLITIALACVFVALLLCIIYRPLLIMTFDSSYARSIGCRVGALDALFCIAAVVVIVTGLQVAGVILTSALLLAPAAAARQLARCMHYTLVAAAVIGCVGTIVGTVVSMYVPHVPAGPAIILTLSACVVIALMRRRRRT
jgi:manganese/zinc/iron transport system permease protein